MSECCVNDSILTETCLTSLPEMIKKTITSYVTMMSDYCKGDINNSKCITHINDPYYDNYTVELRTLKAESDKIEFDKLVKENKEKEQKANDELIMYGGGGLFVFFLIIIMIVMTKSKSKRKMRFPPPNMQYMQPI